MADSITIVKDTNARLYLDVSETATAIGGEVSSEITITGGQREFTNKDSNDWAEFETGTRNFSGRVSANWDDADSATEQFFTHLITSNSRGTLTFKTLNSKEFSGTCLITNISINSDNPGVVKWSADVQGSGALTYSA